MGRLEIVDADCHILEPTDIWETWLPKKYQDKAPKLVKDADDGDAWQFAGSPEPDPIGLVATPGMAWDEFRWTGVKYSDARPGCYDGAERLKDMDIDAAVDTLRKAKARGFHGVVISCWPAGNNDLSEADDPFWAAAAEEGMPVCIHINLISRATRQAQRQAAIKAGGSSLYGAAKEAQAKAKAVGSLGAVFTMVTGAIGNLIFTGVFERFPDLHIACIETGVGWLAHYFEQLDDRSW